MPWGNPAMPTGGVGGPSLWLSGKVFFMGLQFHTRHGHEILKGQTGNSFCGRSLSLALTRLWILDSLTGKRFRVLAPPSIRTLGTLGEDYAYCERRREGASTARTLHPGLVV